VQAPALLGFHQVLAANPNGPPPLSVNLNQLIEIVQYFPPVGNPGL